MSSQTTSNDKLSEIFDVEPIPTVETDNNLPVVSTEQQIVLSDNFEKAKQDSDLEYVRDSLYDLIDKGSEAAANALRVATESQHPRAYEVAGNLIKNVGDLTDKLVALQKAKKELKPEELSAKNINIDKAVFVGSTAELLKRIKNETTD